MARAKKKTTVHKIDFTGIKGKTLLPEDDYLVVVEEVEFGESKSSGNDMFTFIFAVKEGKYEGQNLYFHCPTNEDSLWKLKGLLEAMGVEVPDDEMEVDQEELVGLEVMAVVQHETYEGQKKSKMMDYYAVEEPETKKGKGKAKPKDDEDEDDTKGKKVRGKSKPDEDEEELTPAQKRKARRDARNAKTEKGGKGKGAKDEEDEDEDDTKSSKGKAKGKASKKKPKLTADEVQGMDEDELEGVIEKYELEVDLDDFKTLRKKAAAVIDALEDADMIEDDED